MPKPKAARKHRPAAHRQPGALIVPTPEEPKLVQLARLAAPFLPYPDDGSRDAQIANLVVLTLVDMGIFPRRHKIEVPYWLRQTDQWQKLEKEVPIDELEQLAKQAGTFCKVDHLVSGRLDCHVCSKPIYPGEPIHSLGGDWTKTCAHAACCPACKKRAALAAAA